MNISYKSLQSYAKKIGILIDEFAFVWRIHYFGASMSGTESELESDVLADKIRLSREQTNEDGLMTSYRAHPQEVFFKSRTRWNYLGH
ncbi:hypothetical protein OUZ56_010548 [Daphnia magna]|uniref:Uncharacterized protein n=1 Tax=Daphnia magna TaxID=35525 RepID=A0ABR0AIY4_9CRUS|nr:hypothetical protein OUZ56_010548 [Daphnia magna]